MDFDELLVGGVSATLASFEKKVRYLVKDHYLSFLQLK
jgi:hypothetical protein